MHRVGIPPHVDMWNRVVTMRKDSFVKMKEKLKFLHTLIESEKLQRWYRFRNEYLLTISVSNCNLGWPVNSENLDFEEKAPKKSLRNDLS